MKKVLERIKRFFTPSWKNITILVVDDSEIDRKIILKILSERFTVAMATNGWEGVKMAKELKPNLIFLDFMMPDIQGPEVCAILKQDAATKDIPVVFLTSLDTPASVTSSFEQGAESFLIKPVHRRELLQQVRLTLELDMDNIS